MAIHLKYIACFYLFPKYYYTMYIPYFCVLTSGPLQPVPLCALIVIGPEVKTQNRWNNTYQYFGHKVCQDERPPKIDEIIILYVYQLKMLIQLFLIMGI
jgi:hypothetical protein